MLRSGETADRGRAGSSASALLLLQAAASQARIGARLGRTATPALIDGRAGFVGYQDGRPVALLRFTSNDAGRVQLIEAIADPARVARVLGLQEED